MKETCKHEKCISILAADDDQATLDLISFGASERGWCVDTAHNAREIIEKVNERCSSGNVCYKAIIADLHYFSNLDSNLPRLTGVSAAKTIRETYKDIPIVFVTGFNTYLINKEASKYSNEIVEKPFDLEELLDRVLHYINIYTSDYLGEERRIRSINLTQYKRRASDKQIHINPNLISVIEEAREEKQKCDMMINRKLIGA